MLLPVVLIGALIGVGWLAAAQLGRDTNLGEALLRDLPADTIAVNGTDWDQLRDKFGEGDLLEEARRRDLSTVSVIAANDSALTNVLGFDAVTMRWEIASTNVGGNVLLFGLPGSRGDDEVRTALADAGYNRDGDRFSTTDPTLIEMGIGELRQMRHVEVRDGIVFGADRAKALTELVDAHEGRTERLASGPPNAVVRALVGAPSLRMNRGLEECAAKDPAVEGFEVADQVKAALKEAGDLATYDWLGQSASDRGTRFEIVMGFASAGVAAEQSGVREKLSTGPFIGRSGLIEDELRLQDASWHDTVTTLTFERDPLQSSRIMSGIGPMLFAACR